MKRMNSRVLSWQTMFQPGGPKPYPNIQPGCHEDLILAASLVKLKLILAKHLFLIAYSRTEQNMRNAPNNSLRIA